jgi:hypothetical protein
LGCNKSVTSGIDWFFSQVDKGIVLEDDCIPTSDFFLFCEEMLNRYNDNPQVLHIAGSNHQFGNIRGTGSYYFSRIPNIWGWATWRRAWKLYDYDMRDFDEFKIRSDRGSYFSNSESEAYWMYFFERASLDEITWDYKWTYAVMKERGICVVPNVNLVKNIGFGQLATHAKSTDSEFANSYTEKLPSKLEHPLNLEISDEADLFFIRKMPLRYKALRWVLLRISKFRKYLNSIRITMF